MEGECWSGSCCDAKLGVKSKPAKEKLGSPACQESMSALDQVFKIKLQPGRIPDWPGESGRGFLGLGELPRDTAEKSTFAR